MAEETTIRPAPVVTSEAPTPRISGAEAVTTDNQGNMTVARFPIFGAAGAAYSRALKFSALAQADADSKRKDIEISRQYANNPEGYLKAANQYRDNVVQHVSGLAGPEVGLQ